jgi:hypothetical protein
MRPIGAAAILLVAALVSRVVGIDAQGQRLGEPLAGISSIDLEEFRLGLDDFLEVETAEEDSALRSTARAAQSATTSR